MYHENLCSHCWFLPIINLLIKKFVWNNINGILEARAKKITDDIDEQNQLACKS